MKKEMNVLWLLLFLPVLCFAQSDESISLTATATQLSPFVGQRFTITASVINPSYETISGSLLVKGASGLTFFDPDAQIGTGNQWISGEQTLPSKGGQVQIGVDAIGNEEVNAPIDIAFSYKSKGVEKKIATTLNLTIKQPVCGDGKCEYTENSINCCEDCACTATDKCEKQGSDIKPRCYPKSDIPEMFGSILGTLIVWVFVIVLAIFIIKKIFWHKH
ncbi:MAG: hypothetical protein QME12_01260 [Nanoarchaeota archaeon]|nr:hypothetical protein [Nanoarchaeota archaeon]